MFPVIGWGPPIFHGAGIRITVTDSAITLSPTEDKDELLLKIEAASKHILETLHHTPVVAFGENFHYSVADPPGTLVAALGAMDAEALASHGAGDIHETVLVRSIHLPSCQLNLKIVSGPAEQPWRIEMNYHYAMPTTTSQCEAAKSMAEMMGDTFVSNRNHGLALLRDVYDLQLDEETVREDNKPQS